jgi:hypothetical protein
MATKQCRKCDIVKDISEFSKHTGTADKLDNRCKNCVKLAKQKAKEKEQINEVLTDPPESPYLDTFETDLENDDWQGGKIVGNVFKRTTQNIDYYVASIDGHQKSFNIKKLGGEEKAKELANQYVLENSHKLGLTKNRYKIIKEDGKPKYIIVQLSQGYVMLTDYDKLDIVKKYNLFVRCSQKKDGNNPQNYVGMQDNYTLKYFHKFITGFDMTEHINGYPLDDRKVNLQETDSKKNNNNRTCVNNIVFNDVIEFRKKMVRCVISYIERGTLKKKTVESSSFLNKRDAEKWSRHITAVLDHNSIDINREYLANDFIKIMEKHAGKFKWHDKTTDLTENHVTDKTNDNDQKNDQVDDKEQEQVDDKNNDDQIVDEQKNDKNNDDQKDEQEQIEETINDSDEKSQLDVVEDKTNIYKKFNLINPSYDITQINMSGRAIKHIIDGQNEYKYCSCCKKWNLISDFFANKNNYDGLERRCKPCKRSKSVEYTKTWKYLNKTKISEYNKTYRDKKNVILNV